jgi:tRNA(Arg) A34 adenosine deaminase TadA
MQLPKIVLDVPEWTYAFVDQFRDTDFSTDEAMMRFAIALSIETVNQKTGGPFGAGIFVRDPSDEQMKLLSWGVNRVVPNHNSENHAETLAQGTGQQKVEYFSLKRAGLKDVTLATSCEMCAKCLGSTEWAGLDRILIGAPAAFAEEIGFNEGNKPTGWRDDLRTRLKIDVREGICVDEAKVAFDEYKRRNGVIYNGADDENLVMGIPGAKIRLATNGSLITAVYFSEPGKAERELCPQQVSK